MLTEMILPGRFLRQPCRRDMTATPLLRSMPVCLCYRLRRVRQSFLPFRACSLFTAFSQFSLADECRIALASSPNISHLVPNKDPNDGI